MLRLAADELKSSIEEDTAIKIFDQMLKLFGFREADHIIPFKKDYFSQICKALQIVMDFDKYQETLNNVDKEQVRNRIAANLHAAAPAYKKKQDFYSFSSLLFDQNLLCEHLYFALEKTPQLRSTTYRLNPFMEVAEGITHQLDMGASDRHAIDIDLAQALNRVMSYDSYFHLDKESQNKLKALLFIGVQKDKKILFLDVPAIAEYISSLVVNELPTICFTECAITPARLATVASYSVMDHKDLAPIICEYAHQPLCTTARTMQIFARKWTGQTIACNVAPNEKIKDLKHMIRKRVGSPVSILYGGRQLTDTIAAFWGSREATLKSYNIEKESAVSLRPAVIFGGQ